MAATPAAKMTATQVQTLNDVLDVLTAQPGATPAQIAAALPAPGAPEDLFGGPHAVPVGAVLALLRVLQRAGKARTVPDPHGARWYRTGGTP
jgi:hypothetical protein